MARRLEMREGPFTFSIKTLRSETDKVLKPLPLNPKLRVKQMYKAAAQETNGHLQPDSQQCQQEIQKEKGEN